MMIMMMMMITFRAKVLSSM